MGYRNCGQNQSQLDGDQATHNHSDSSALVLRHTEVQFQEKARPSDTFDQDDSEQEKPGLMIATKLKIKDCLKIKNCCPNCPSTFLFSSKLSVHIRRTCCTNDRRSSVSILNCRCSINSNTIVLRHLWMWYQRLQARGCVGNDIADWHYDLLNVQNCGILHIFNFIDQISGSFSMEGLPQNGKSVCFTTTKLSLLDPGPSCKSLALFFNHKVREVCWGRCLCQFFATVA